MIFEDIVGKVNIKELKPVNHVSFILDCSGSMFSITDRSRDSFNEQLQRLKSESHDQDTYVTLAMFNEKVEFKYVDRPINECEELTEYPANGMTALYDAIGLTINKIIHGVKKEENHSALIVIITDGHENASTDYFGEEGRKKVKSKVEELEGEGNWTFTFLGANVDVEQVASEGLAMSMANTMSFDGCDSGVEAASLNINSGIGNYYNARRSGETQTSSFYGGSDGDKTQGETTEEEEDKGQTIKG